MTFGDFVAGLFGEKGQIALAGAAGGLVRWLRLKSHWTDGVIAIIVGSITAIYLHPLAEPLVDGLLGSVVVDASSRAALSGFVIGLGGVGVAGFVIDAIAARMQRKRDEEEDSDDDDGQDRKNGR